MTRVLIAGGGIGGLVAALTMHQIGVPCTVFEAEREIVARGVGMNLQPNAVRELFELGIDAAALNSVGLPIREWAMLGLNGREIWAEERGVGAGFRWPQFSVDRGLLHLLLYRTALQRLGPRGVVLGTRVAGYRQTRGSVTALLEDGREAEGKALIGADGLHSRVRAQMYPDQPPIHWGGAVLWRVVSRARPLRSGSSFVAMGAKSQRLVCYPISHPGPDGRARINWICDMPVPDHPAREPAAWFKPVPVASIAHRFDDWRLDWLDVPALIQPADTACISPVIDRDPVPSWRDGRVVLLGDAAHAMYPTGSTGASQAIIDARVLGAAMVDHGVTARALHRYDDGLCAPVSALVLRNRGDGPFQLLKMVEARSGGVFDDIDRVIPRAERAAFLARYTLASEFAREMLNSSPPMIPPGARVAA